LTENKKENAAIEKKILLASDKKYLSTLEDSLAAYKKEKLVFMLKPKNKLKF
jgi:hypothetical protein